MSGRFGKFAMDASWLEERAKAHKPKQYRPIDQIKSEVVQVRSEAESKKDANGVWPKDLVRRYNKLQQELDNAVQAERDKK